MTGLTYIAPVPVLISCIDVLDRYRTLSPDRIDALAISMKEIGLQTPIDIMDLGDDACTLMLITGAGRLAAARQLGWTHILSRYAEGTINDAKLWEVDENLSSIGLTDMERRDHTAIRIGLILTRQAEAVNEAARLPIKRIRVKAKSLPQVEELLNRQPDEKKGRGRPKGGVAAAAREAGVSEATARRMMKVASVTPEAKAAATEAGIVDNQTAMLRVASVAPEQQVAAVVLKPKPTKSNPVDFEDLLLRYIAHCETHDSDADLATSTIKFLRSEIVIIDAMRAGLRADKVAA